MASFVGPAGPSSFRTNTKRNLENAVLLNINLEFRKIVNDDPLIFSQGQIIFRLSRFSRPLILPTENESSYVQKLFNYYWNFDIILFY